mgnify:CR=1 FL=1
MFNALVLLAEELATWTTANCQPFDASFVAHSLSFTRYMGVLITLGLFIGGIRYCELYLLLFGFAAILNDLLNLLIRAIVRDTTTVTATCVDVYGSYGNWPSLQTQQISFVVVFLLTYGVCYNARPNIVGSLSLAMLFSAVIAGDLLLNYHTKSQIYGGLLVGGLFAFLVQIVYRLFVVPYIPRMILWPVLSYFEYTDTLCIDASNMPGSKMAPYSKKSAPN